MHNNGTALTSSLRVAETFGKEHKDVLEGIRKLIEELRDCEDGGNFRSPQVWSKTVPFKPIPTITSKYFLNATYVNQQNKQQPCYNLTRDGFTLLAMGFTGKRALRFKLKYIEAFNKMEEIIAKNTIDGVNNNANNFPREIFALYDLTQRETGCIEFRNRTARPIH